MGLRSWLTPVYSEPDFKKVIKFIEKYNDGVWYVIQITKKGKHPYKLGDVLIAWSGDGSSSKYGLKPNISYAKTYLLDSFIDYYPNWHSGKVGPQKYGKYIRKEESPDWSIVIKPQLVKYDFWFEDFVFVVETKMIYKFISSSIDQDESYELIFLDGNDIIYKIVVNYNSKFPSIYRLNANMPDKISPQTIYEFEKTAERIFITDKLEIKSLLKYLKTKPKKSFTDIL
jgi:hypothetical protein